MRPRVRSTRPPRGQNLAARHYQNRWIPDNQCYSCHTDYHIFGGLRAKAEGVGHLVRYYTGRYQLPIRIAGPHRSTICLHCHGPAVKYQKVELHQQLAADLLANKTSCAECHGRASGGGKDATMSDREQRIHPPRALLRTMGVFTILGLLSAIVFLLKYSPLTLVLFIVGQVCIFIGIVLYVYMIVRDLKEHKIL